MIDLLPTWDGTPESLLILPVPFWLYVLVSFSCKNTARKCPTNQEVGPRKPLTC